MELVTLSDRELQRSEVLQALLLGHLRQDQAARFLNVSVRQLRRILRRFQADGAAGLASRRRAHKPNNAFSSERRQLVLERYRLAYPDFGPTLAAEKLRELDGIVISRETLRNWLIEEQLWKASKRRAKPRPPRARRECFGELVQIDGSPHAWFEDRGPRCSLLLAVDDATGTIGAAHFAPHETTSAYFTLFQQYFARYGLPEGFYSDRHSIFRVNVVTTEGNDQTQVARALAELDIELICANSPQAKGRVERANRTLQDRLLKELRLANVSSIDAGNAFLPTFLDSFNARFARVATSTYDAHRDPALHDLEAILCHRFERTMSKNATVQYDDKIFALSGPRRLCAGMRIQVLIAPNGQINFSHRNERLEHRLVQRLERNPAIVSSKELAERPTRPRDMPQKAHTPAKNHPWRIPRPAPKADISALQAPDITALR